MKNWGALYTEQDDAVLTALHRQCTYKEIAEKLGRSETALKARARVLRLKKMSTRRWSDDEVAQLRHLAPNHTTTELAAILGRARSVIYNKLLNEGIKCKPGQRGRPPKGLYRKRDSRGRYVKV